eukprot:GHVP01057652.1.p1 GENE.GHVP01057652.1~~GHVP01057652.1.p1  ORF type:complete len:196 (+),score=46.66 GHVP01057652.1:1120-1707(+)
MSVLSVCNDFFRDCAPPEEHFEFGIYVPKDEFRPDAPPPEPSEGDEEGGAEPEDDVPAPTPQEKNKAMQEFEAKSGGKKTLSVEAAASLVRSSGLAPSQAELQKFREEKGDNITFEDLEDFKKKCHHKEDNPEHLGAFFRYYDPTGTGKLSRAQVKNLLANYGEPLTDPEIEAIFKELGVGDPVDYVDFCSKLFE